MYHSVSTGIYVSVNSSCAQPPPLPGYCRAFARLSVPGWGIYKFCAARGPGICQPRGYSRTFETHAVSYQNITTQRILLKKRLLKKGGLTLTLLFVISNIKILKFSFLGCFTRHKQY